jgi:hypothetical protein
VKKVEVSRRDFGKLTLAAFGGALAGSLLGSSPLSAEEAKAAAREAHSCCGLNTCKGNGAGADNACAGQGTCSTVEAHGCGGENACKNQGPDYANDCAGKGSCAVPMRGESWKKARANYEAAMKKAGREFGAAPESCGK